MVLKKPYALFIRLFKPIHLLIAFLLTYLIYNQNTLLDYFNKYIHSNVSGTSIHVSSAVFVIPIIVIVSSILIFAVMLNKSKPVRFYLVSMALFLAVIVINVYAFNYAKVISNSIVSVKVISFVHDLTVINIGIEIVEFILFLTRGLGLNIRKFDFSSDLLKIDVSDSDREEVEVSLNIDTDLKRRIRKGRIRQLKYFYKENVIICNIIIGVFIIFVGFGIYFVARSSNPVKPKNFVYSGYNFSFKINDSYVVDSNYKGDDLGNLIVVDTSMMSNNNSNVSLSSFNLVIEGVKFNALTKYKNDLLDMGNTYNEDYLSNEYEDYLLVFDVPVKYMDSKMALTYKDISIRVKPKTIKIGNLNKSFNIGEDISFKESLGEINLKINEFDINSKYLINYNYCYKDYCIDSKEYLKPSINENFDKAVMRLNVEFGNKSDIKINDFYSFLSKFGSISYELNGNTYVQNSNFEKITTNRNNDGYIYIGVNSNIMSADSIKLVFNIRGSVYECKLR